MNLNIKTTNISLTPDIKDYFEKKLLMLGRLVDFDRDDVFMYAELGKTTRHHRAGDIYRAEMNMKIGAKRIYAAVECQSLHESIDDLKDEIEDQLKSSKDKRLSLLKRGARAVKNAIRFGRRGDRSDSRGSYGR